MLLIYKAIVRSNNASIVVLSTHSSRIPSLYYSFALSLAKAPVTSHFFFFF